MSSVVHYKFKSQREASRVVFDGTAISVWDLKREIIIRNKMGKGIDFDIGLYNAQTEEEYRDDNFSIPRSSTVIVRRLPPSRPGRGTAQTYVADLYGGADAGESSRFGPSASGVAQQRDRAAGPSYRGPMSVRFDDRAKESATPGPPPVLPPSIAQQSGENGGGDEAAGIAAMFQATTDQWDATQQQMATATYRPRGGGPPRGGGRGGSFQPRGDRGGDHHPHSDRPPPTGYICYRCGKKGHWIQECPTNKDPDWDDKPRFKRTTGIPKSMLKTVENPTDEQRQSGVMVTADGTYVVAQVDSATWEKERATGVKVLSKSDVYQSVPSDSTLACPLCSKLLRNPVQTPCCSTKFCEECIQTHLLEHDFSCAECDKRIADLGNLKRDDETRRKVENYVEEAVKKSEEEIREREQQQQQREEGDKKEENAGDEAKGKEQEGAATDEAATAAEVTPAAQEPAIPVVAFNPQLVQQLVMTLSNPQLPPPMRAMLQTQLQAQQMAFMRMQQNGPPPQQPGIGMGMQPMMMGGGPNPMMGMMMGGGGGGGAMAAMGGTMNGGMNGGMNSAMGGYGRPPPPPPQRMGNGVGAGMMGRGGFRPPVAAHGMKRGRDASSLEGGPGFDPSKMARMQ